MSKSASIVIFVFLHIIVPITEKLSYCYLINKCVKPRSTTSVNPQAVPCSKKAEIIRSDENYLQHEVMMGGGGWKR